MTMEQPGMHKAVGGETRQGALSRQEKKNTIEQ
jgi:hypothetical protein